MPALGPELALNAQEFSVEVADVAARAFASLENGDPGGTAPITNQRRRVLLPSFGHARSRSDHSRDSKDVIKIKYKI
jgi:hypothetical protein